MAGCEIDTKVNDSCSPIIFSIFAHGRSLIHFGKGSKTANWSNNHYLVQFDDRLNLSSASQTRSPPFPAQGLGIATPQRMLLISLCKLYIRSWPYMVIIFLIISSKRNASTEKRKCINHRHDYIIVYTCTQLQSTKPTQQVWLVKVNQIDMI